MNLNQLISKYVKNPLLQRMLVYTMSDGLSRAMPFLVLPLIANYITVKDFGLVSNFTVMIELFAAFVSFSAAFSLGVDYFRVDRPKLISNLIVMMTGLFCLAFIVILLFNKQIYDSLRLPLQWQVYALFTAYFNSINQLYVTKLRYDEKAKLFGVLQFVRAAVSAGLSLLLVIVIDWSWQGRTFSLVFTGLLLAVISVIMLRKEKMIFHHVNWKSVYSGFLFGLPLLPQSLSVWLRGAFEKVLVTRSIGLASNGLLSFSGTIASIFQLFTGAFFSSYTPLLYKSLTAIEKQPTSSNRILADVLKKAYLFFAFLLVATVIGNFVTVFLIEHYFNKGYQGAVKFMPLALLSVFLSAVSSWQSSFLMFKKRTKMLGFINITQTILQALITYYMVLKFQTIGAFYGSLIGCVLKCWMLFVTVNKEYKLPWFNLSQPAAAL